MSIVYQKVLFTDYLLRTFQPIVFIYGPSGFFFPWSLDRLGRASRGGGGGGGTSPKGGGGGGSPASPTLSKGTDREGGGGGSPGRIYGPRVVASDGKVRDTPGIKEGGGGGGGGGGGRIDLFVESILLSF